MQWGDTVNTDEKQTFDDRETTSWQKFEGLEGITIVPLAEPVDNGSIHRARLTKGTIIPTHIHPAPEYVYIVSGTIETGGRRCEAGAFWSVPPNIRQGPHIAISDVEILTIRLGALGVFEEA